jgi:hypothetical protein
MSLFVSEPESLHEEVYQVPELREHLATDLTYSEALSGHEEDGAHTRAQASSGA